MSKRHRLNNYITREFEVYIDDINSRGWGRGEIEDEGRRVPVEVRGAFPGDRVRVVGRHIEDSRVQCGIVEFLEKSIRVSRSAVRMHACGVTRILDAAGVRCASFRMRRSAM